MNRAATLWRRWQDELLILFTALIAYLPLANQLGFYRDDWHVMWGGTLIGPQKIIDLHLTDRPVMGVIYSLTFSILGNSPLAWQLYVIGLRILGGLLFLWLLRLVWPGQRRAAALMALLFTIYPGFLQMPTASAYSNHLLGLGLGLFSLICTIKAPQAGRLWQRSGLVLCAIFSSLVCFLIMEYMISLEGVRILLLIYLFTRQTPGSLIKRGLHTLKLWAPYLAGLLVFLAWRILFFKSARAATDVGSLASSYLAQPGYMLARVIVETLKGVLNALWLSWSVPFYNQTMTASPGSLLAAFLLALAAVGLFTAYLRLGQDKAELRSETPQSQAWGRQAVGLGLLLMVINIIPVVLANRDVRLTDTLDRYTLPASIGMVMVLVGLLFWIMRGQARFALVAALIAISIITHYNNAVFFKNFWSYQKQLWWQLAWRAPAIKPDTVLMAALPPPFMLAESYEIWGPANLLYATPQNPQVVVGEAVNTEAMHSVITQTSFTRSMRRVMFTLDFKNTLLVSIPTASACLRVQDQHWLEYSENESLLVRQMAPYSNIELIDTTGQQKRLPSAIFGPEPPHTWCYYYQKANLARQQQDWAEVVRLGDEARAQGLRPQDTMEWLPFYQGYAYQKRMDDANDLAWAIRGEQIALKEFCTQFSADERAQLGKGTIREFIIINLCP